jgi:hypothetical protein
MALISTSMMFADTSRAPNNVHLRFTLQRATRSQANVLSLPIQGE